VKFCPSRGSSDPYEEPLSPELRIDTSVVSVAHGTMRILSKLNELGYGDATQPREHERPAVWYQGRP